MYGAVAPDATSAQEDAGGAAPGGRGDAAAAADERAGLVVDDDEAELGDDPALRLKRYRSIAQQHGGGNAAAAAVAPNGEVWEKYSKEEPMVTSARAVFPVMLLALVSLALCGSLLAEVQVWSVYHDMEELLVLVPVLLGMKDNVVMTMASRLTTAAAVGEMDTLEDTWQATKANVCVMQTQSMAIAGIATVLVLLVDAVPGGLPVPDATGTLALFTAAIAALSLATLAVGSIAVSVIQLSRALGVDPDNVVTPVVGSVGDLVALYVLSCVGAWVNDARRAGDVGVLVGVLLACLLWAAYCVHSVARDEVGSGVLTTSWVPIIGAFGMSFTAGLFLDQGVQGYADLSLLLPVMNGMGGNMVCVYACRLSTAVQTQGGSEAGTRTLGALMLLLTPICAVLFLLAVHVLHLGQPVVSVGVTIASDYLFASLVQVLLLELFARWLVAFCWRHDLDSDNYATPFVNSLADTLGSALLWGMFVATREQGGGSGAAVRAARAAGIVPWISGSQPMRLRRRLLA
jgi:solute carrier family 41